MDTMEWAGPRAGLGAPFPPAPPPNLSFAVDTTPSRLTEVEHSL